MALASCVTGILSRPRVGPFPCCCGLADGGVADRPQELETSFVTVALVAGQRSALQFIFSSRDDVGLV